jgi:hypothetical protein
LEGRPAIEVITRISESLSDHAEGLERDVLSKTLKDTILEIAALDNELGFEKLEEALESFISENGVSGFLEVFLTRYVLDAIWMLIEQHSQSSSPGESELEALFSAVEHVCRNEVREHLSEIRQSGRLGKINWFGDEGIRIADEIISLLESRLMRLAA